MSRFQLLRKLLAEGILILVFGGAVLGILSLVIIIGHWWGVLALVVMGIIYWAISEIFS